MSENTVKRVRVQHLRRMKEQREPITMLTCYDAVTARIFDAAGIDVLLVGDSYGNTYLGYESTVSVSLEEMEVATAAVARGAKRAFIVADLPFGSYEESCQLAVASAVRLIKAGAHAVKLEGGLRQASAIKAIVEAGILVVGHIGFTPQSENRLGGPRVQGRGEQKEAVIEDAVAVQEAGASAVVLEMVPADVAKKVTRILRIPTIGIGAGAATDGQVLVWTDMAGMTDWSPRFSKRFGDVGGALALAAAGFRDAVKGRGFPTEENSF